MGKFMLSPSKSERRALILHFITSERGINRCASRLQTIYFRASIFFFTYGARFYFPYRQKEKNVAAGPPRKAMGQLQAAVKASVGEQVLRRITRIDVVGLKALGVGDATLIASIL